jgi:hypothetical protein
MANRVIVGDESVGFDPHILLPGLLVPSGAYWTISGAPPTGPAGGVLAGMYPNPTLAAYGPGATGPYGSATRSAVVTIDAYGRISGFTDIAIALPFSQISGTVPVGQGGTGTATAFTQGSIVFAGPLGVYAQDNGNLFWDDSTNKMGLRHVLPTRDLHVKYSSNTGSLATLPTVSVENVNIGVYGVSSSYASFEMTANNRAMVGEFFADGPGNLNPNKAVTAGIPCLYFRTSTASSIVHGTSGLRREHLSAAGTWTLGLAEGHANAFHQIGQNGTSDTDNTTTQSKVVGSVTNSTVEETLVRWGRKEAVGSLYPSSADWRAYSYAAGGAPFGPYTGLALYLKSVPSYNLEATTKVIDFRANGQVAIPGTLTVGGISTTTRNFMLMGGIGKHHGDDLEGAWPIGPRCRGIDDLVYGPRVYISRWINHHDLQPIGNGHFVSCCGSPGRCRHRRSTLHLL